MRDLARNDALRGSPVATGAPNVHRYGCGAAPTAMDVEVAGDASGPVAMNVPSAPTAVALAAGRHHSALTGAVP